MKKDNNPKPALLNLGIDPSSLADETYFARDLNRDTQLPSAPIKPFFEEDLKLQKKQN